MGWPPVVLVVREVWCRGENGEFATGSDVKATMLVAWRGADKSCAQKVAFSPSGSTSQIVNHSPAALCIRPTRCRPPLVLSVVLLRTYPRLCAGLLIRASPTSSPDAPQSQLLPHPHQTRAASFPTSSHIPPLRPIYLRTLYAIRSHGGFTRTAAGQEQGRRPHPDFRRAAFARGRRPSR